MFNNIDLLEFGRKNTDTGSRSSSIVPSNFDEDVRPISI